MNVLLLEFVFRNYRNCYPKITQDPRLNRFFFSDRSSYRKIRYENVMCVGSSRRSIFAGRSLPILRYASGCSDTELDNKIRSS